MKYAILILCFSALVSCTSKTPNQEPYWQRRQNFKTQLIKEIKAPQSFDSLRASANSDTLRLVHFESEGMRLQGLLHTQNIDSNKKSPAMVYLHGGFALGYGDVYDCDPFTKAGYVVFAPSYRGENGNPGNFELFMGEVTDAEAAVEWISKQNYIDSERVYVFGHSIGGGMSLLLSLNNRSTAALHGSSSGLYLSESLHYLAGAGAIPFDIMNTLECSFRVPIDHLHELPRKHLMYMGTDDQFRAFYDQILYMYGSRPSLFAFREVKGNHFSSLPMAMQLFTKEIELLEEGSVSSLTKD